MDSRLLPGRGQAEGVEGPIGVLHDIGPRCSFEHQLRADDVLPTGTLEEMERDYILRAVREANGVISAAATRLGIPRTTLNAMMLP